MFLKFKALNLISSLSYKFPKYIKITLTSQGHTESLLSCFIQDPVLFYIKETTNIGLARKHPGQLPLRSANL